MFSRYSWCRLINPIVIFVKSGFLLLVLSVLSVSVYAQISPSLSLDKDPICKVFRQSYSKALLHAGRPSFITTEIPSHPDNSMYTPTAGSVKPIHFTNPIVDDRFQWMHWYPIAGITHSFKWGGTSTDVTAIGAIKPSADSSLVLQANTIGWRGPFYRLWMVKDAQLNALVSTMTPEQVLVPIEGSGARLVFPHQERAFYSSFTNLFQFEGSFYRLTNDKVFKLKADQSSLVCQLGLNTSFSSSQINALKVVANRVLMTSGVTHIPGYYGSMGNPHRQVKNGFFEAIHMPWLYPVDKKGQCTQAQQANLCALDLKVEAVLEEFASRDPWSYREVEVIRQHMDAAEAALSQYYIDELELDLVRAKGVARRAVFAFLAKTVSSHPMLKSEVSKVKSASDSYTLDEFGTSIETNWFNKTALMWAAHFNDVDAINALVDSGVLINAVTATDDKYASVQYLNRSALTYAAENATLPVIQALLRAGADTSIKDSQGNGLEYYFKKNILLQDTSLNPLSLTEVEINPSFDCTLARTRQEKAICASQGLSVYDAQLGALYKKVRASGRYPNIKPLQRNWLRALKSNCNSADQDELIQCMKPSYRVRIKYLSNLLSLDVP